MSLLVLVLWGLIPKLGWAQSTASFPEPPSGPSEPDSKAPSARVKPEKSRQAEPPPPVPPSPEPSPLVPPPPPPAPPLPAPPSPAPPLPAEPAPEQENAEPGLPPVPEEPPELSESAAEITPAAGSSSTVSAKSGPAARLPYRLPYQEGDPMPPGYHVETRYQTGTLVAGGVILGGGYAAGIASSGTLHNGSGWMLVPIVGPFGAMLSQDLTCPTQSSNTVSPGQPGTSDSQCAQHLVGTGRTMALLFMDGLVQFTGAAVLLVGLLSSDDELVRDDTTGVSVSWVQPRWSAQEVGLDIGGRF